MASEHHIEPKPSDRSAFYVAVYMASATVMDFETYMDVYGDIMEQMFWNVHIDMPLAISQTSTGRFQHA